MVDLKLGDCLDVLKTIDNDSIDLIVTSPPYYNAREYSHYNSYEEFLSLMKSILIESKRVIKNQKYIIYNIADVICDNKKYSLTSDFTQIMQNLGLVYEDMFIWDKGEVQSKRGITAKHLPYYFKPINCYETILVFRKNELNKERIRCPLCNSDRVRVNGIMNDGVYSFECGNKDCKRSKSDRGFRFSERSILMQFNNDKEIPDEICETFRRDIIKIDPVKKINSKGENILGHTAPFPIKLVSGFIEIYSKEQDIILDNFMGSGTTGVSCVDTNRSFIGIEKDPKYFEIAQNRIEQSKIKHDKIEANSEDW